MTNILLEGKNLTKSFASKKKNKRIHAVSDINLTIRLILFPVKNAAHTLFEV